MEHLNWGYIQLGLVAMVFGGLQLWWISGPRSQRDCKKKKSISIKENAVLDTNSSNHILSPFGDLARVTGEL